MTHILLLGCFTLYDCTAVYIAIHQKHKSIDKLYEHQYFRMKFTDMYGKIAPSDVVRGLVLPCKPSDGCYRCFE